MLVGYGESGLQKTAEAGSVAAKLAAGYAVYATLAAAAERLDDAVAYAADAAIDACAYAYAAADAADTFEKNIVSSNDSDIESLKLNSLDQFLTSPLWLSGMPTILMRHWLTLKFATCRFDPGFAFWLDWYQDRLDGKPMDVALMRQVALLPESIAAQSVPQINAYLLQLREQARLLKPLNRVRAIFIGYGEAGKTSVIRVLNNQEVCPQEPQTAGIDIHEWKVPGTDIQAHFWDFGGQVMVHATHQLFLREACLYVLVLSARSEINATEQAEYWLEHVKSFGGNSPVLIVGNRADQADLNINMANLREKYPNIVRYFPLSCLHATTSHQSHFKAFYDEFCQQLRALGLHQVMFTPPQFGVLQALRQNPASFLSKRKFEALCKKHNVGNDGVHNRAWLLDILDKLGTIIHFPTLPFIDGYVLNPRWLTYGVYTLMYAKQSHLSHKEIASLLCNQPVQDAAGNRFSYTPSQCRLIMDAMRQFKLCYSLPDAPDTLIIPALLEASQPDTAPYKTDALAFELEFATFLPRHIMPELIVQRHQEIHAQQVWQTGVVLKASRASKLVANALLQVDYQRRALQIWVQGRDAREYLVILRDEVQKILGRLTIEYDEYVILPASARIPDGDLTRVPNFSDAKPERALYQQLLALARRGNDEYVSKADQVYSVSHALNMFVIAKSQEPRVYQFLTQNFLGPVGHSHTNQQASQTATQETNVGNNNVSIEGSHLTGNVSAGNLNNSHNTTTMQNTPPGGSG